MSQWRPNEHRGQTPNDGKWAHDMPASRNQDEIDRDRATREKEAWLAGKQRELDEYQAEVDARSSAARTQAAQMQAEAVAVVERSVAYLKGKR